LNALHQLGHLDKNKVVGVLLERLLKFLELSLSIGDITRVRRQQLDDKADMGRVKTNSFECLLLAIAAGTTSPFSALRTASTVSSSNEDRLPTVRFLVLPFSRHDSRRSTAGGEFRLGTRSIYMGSYYAHPPHTFNHMS